MQGRGMGKKRKHGAGSDDVSESGGGASAPGPDLSGIFSGLQQLFTPPVTPVAAGSAGGASHKRSKKVLWSVTRHAVAAWGIEGVVSSPELRSGSLWS